MDRLFLDANVLFSIAYGSSSLEVFWIMCRHGRCKLLASAYVIDGLHLFKSRKDKDWSLTDWISFVVMRKNGIKKALTSDHHFIQAGFEKLLDIDRA